MSDSFDAFMADSPPRTPSGPDGFGGGGVPNSIPGWHRDSSCWFFAPTEPMTLNEASAAIDAVSLDVVGGAQDKIVISGFP